MTSNTNYQNGGLGFFSVLFLVFLVLKLTNNITWSWWWITCPLWGPVSVFLGFIIAFFTFIMITALFNLIIKKILSRKN
jgi:hypothetical protein